ncbi:MAG: tetratricopeptide repeat protein, partial [Candidatus Paceibacterota bacterium]
GAYDRADQALAEAIERNPKSPALRLQRARLEIANEDLQAARTYIAEARELKSNYTEAIFLLAQIEASEGNIAEAIAQTEQVANLAPRDAGLLFQLGLLYYQDENYSGAVQALGRATELVDGYANAQYFLGLSQYRLGNTEEAIALFEGLVETNPDNSDLQQILTNMRNNFPLFEGVSDPISDQVESDTELPVEETSPEEGTSEANISEDEVVEGADAEEEADEE